MDNYRIRVRMEPKYIVMLDNVMEGYDGLAIVSTGDPKLGEVTLHVTPDTYEEVIDIIGHLPWPITIME